MADGSVYKRCPHGTTGTPGRPACKKTHGTWWWRADALRDPVTGKRRQPAKGGYASKSEAQAALAEFLGKRNKRRWRDDRRITVGEWFDKWFTEGDWEALTRATYELHVATIWRPRIGAYRLRDLDRWHVEEVLREVAVDEHGKRRMPRTLRSYQATLRAALTAAMNAGLLGENVAAGDLKSIPRTHKTEVTVWQPAELALFLAATVDDPFAPMWRVAAFTGLRRAELCGLRWCDVELDGQHPGITIRQTVPALAGRHACHVCGGEHTGAFIKPTPKSDAGARWVPLVGEASAGLESALRLHAYPTLGDLPLATIANRPSMIQAWVKRLSGDLSPATVGMVHGVVSGIFKAAIRDRRVPHNPCQQDDVTEETRCLT